MSVQITKQPAPISFSRNPVVFQLKTDAQLQSAGKRFIAKMQVTYPTNGYTFNLSYAGLSLDFTFYDNPDTSGYQLRSRWVGATDQAYTESVAYDLKGNFYIGRDFDISTFKEGEVFYIRFSAKQIGQQFNIVLNGVNYLGLSYLQSGENSIANPNFKLYYELWVQPLTGGEAIKCNDAYLEVNTEGIANIDVSGQLTDALLNGGYDRPDFSSAIALVNTRSVKKFFLRYAEVYGETQAIRQVKQTDTFYTMLGGISNEMLPTFAFPGNFMAGGLLKFMKQEPAEKYILPEQAEYLTAVLFDAGLLGVQLKFTLYFDDDSSSTIYKHAVGDQPRYAKLTFPVGFVQNNLNLVSLEKPVVKYTVEMVWGNNEVISESRTYWLDYNYYPYIRQFIYLSSFGTYDTLVTFGRGSNQYDLVQSQAEINTDKGFMLADGETINYSVTLNHTETVASGYMSKAGVRIFKDLALSLDMLLFRKKRVYAVAFSTKTVKEFKDAENLHAVSFDFGYRYNEELFTVDDQDDLDVPLFMPRGFAGAPADAPLPDGSLDYRYYLKSETYNQAEVNNLVNQVKDMASAVANDLIAAKQELELDIANRAPANHTHDERYMQIAELADILQGIGNLSQPVISSKDLTLGSLPSGLQFVNPSGSDIKHTEGKTTVTGEPQNFNTYIGEATESALKTLTQSARVIAGNNSNVWIGNIRGESYQAYIGLDPSDGVYGGKIYSYTNANPGAGPKQQTADALQFQSGDVILIVQEWNRDRITTTITNTTRPSPQISDTYVFNLNSYSPISIPQYGTLAIGYYSGSLQILSYTIYRPKTNQEVVFFGNSIFTGYVQNDVQQTISGYLGDFPVIGSAGATAANMIGSLDELYSLKPKYAIIELGANDIFQGTSQADYIAAIKTETDGMVANGIIPVLTTILPVSPNADILNTALKDNFKSKYQIIDINSATRDYNGGYKPGLAGTDGIHPSRAGALVIAREINRSMPYVFGKNLYDLDRHYAENVEIQKNLDVDGSITALSPSYFAGGIGADNVNPDAPILSIVNTSYESGNINILTFGDIKNRAAFRSPRYGSYTFTSADGLSDILAFNATVLKWMGNDVWNAANFNPNDDEIANVDGVLGLTGDVMKPWNIGVNLGIAPELVDNPGMTIQNYSLPDEKRIILLGQYGNDFYFRSPALGSYKFSTADGLGNILNFNPDLFKYLEFDVWHSGNLPIGQKGQSIRVNSQGNAFEAFTPDKTTQNVRSNGTLTLDAEQDGYYTYSGAGATWTLTPNPVGNPTYHLKNAGTGMLTIEGQIFSDQIVSNIVLAVGQARTIHFDGLLYQVY